VLALFISSGDERAAAVRGTLERGWVPLDISLTGTRILAELRPAMAFVDSTSDEALIRRLREHGCHIVRAGMALPLPAMSDLPAVVPDLRAQGRLAAEHLAEHRFKDLAYVGYSPLTEGRVLYEGFRERAAELGCRCHLCQFEPSPKRESPGERFDRRRLEFTDWMGTLPRPLALFTYSDRMAVALCEMCYLSNLDVPAEVGILGRYNVVDVCEASVVRLSSLDCDVGGLVRTALDLLAGMREGRAAAREPLLVPPLGVVTRDSTDVLATADRAVAAALRYLWDHVQRNLSVRDVAEAVGVPLRSLQRAFRHELGHGINDELRRRRLERCHELLRSTDRTVAEIAALVGFGSTVYLHQAFRRRYGMTPGECRRQARNAASCG
jgi:LacI family transcriptional regulator